MYKYDFQFLFWQYNIYRLFENNITSKGAIILFSILNTYCKSSLIVIDFSNNYLDDECLRNFGEFIHDNQVIEKINIGGERNNISDKGMEVFLPYFLGNNSLKQIDISSNKGITNISIPLIKEVIEKSKIQEIEMRHTNIKAKNIISIPLAANVFKYGICEKIDYSERWVIKFNNLDKIKLILTLEKLMTKI